MKFEKHLPAPQLTQYIKYYVVSENHVANEYKVLPNTGLVIGFQYKGKLSVVSNGIENKLATAGITGIADSYKVFKNTAGVGTVLVYFTETGFAHFATAPANELFNLSVPLHDIFDKDKLAEVEDRLAAALTDIQRIKIVERFLLLHLKNIQTDKLITEAVKLIYQSNGSIRIKALHEKLFISQSPFEKRFRKVVGTSPKKFADIIRLNHVLGQLGKSKSLSEICYENNFFDQAHFSKHFKQLTGDTPENFKRLL